MNKLYKLFCLALIVVSSYAANGQTATSDAPTRQDALDFLNEILRDHPVKVSIDSLYKGITVGLSGYFTPQITAHLEGQNLVITSHVIRAVAKNNQDTVDWHHTVTINLSSVQLSDHDVSKWGYLDVSCLSVKNEDILDHHYNLWHMLGKHKKYEVGTSYDRTIAVSKYLIITPLITEDGSTADVDAYLESIKPYAERYVKAFVFLVKAYGGGEIKKDKF